MRVYIEEPPKKKLAPRGDFGKNFEKYHWKKGQSGNPGGRAGHSMKKISEAYAISLQMEVPEEERIQLQLPVGATWAMAIANQMLRRAVALIASDKLDFKAVTELRETCEGKTPERAVVTGNSELQALSASLMGGPALSSNQVIKNERIVAAAAIHKMTDTSDESGDDEDDPNDEDE